ncbi:MAG: hypothetical protein QXI58_06315 [Candidatus Micrarchaeia archaeon]
MNTVILRDILINELTVSPEKLGPEERRKLFSIVRFPRNIKILILDSEGTGVLARVLETIPFTEEEFLELVKVCEDITISSNFDLSWYLSRNPHLSQKVLLRMASSKVPLIRIHTLNNPNFTPEMLIESKLLFDKNYFVKRAVERYIKNKGLVLFDLLRRVNF